MLLLLVIALVPLLPLIVIVRGMQEAGLMRISQIGSVILGVLAAWQAIDYATTPMNELNDRTGEGAVITLALSIVAGEALAINLFRPIKNLVTRYLAWEQAQIERNQ